eukprot:scaffold26954_cov50-Phaeocystis_antarctica.AAC.2
MVAIMVTLCCALMVRVCAWSANLVNLVADAPNRLDVADLNFGACTDAITGTASEPQASESPRRLAQRKKWGGLDN